MSDFSTKILDLNTRAILAYGQEQRINKGIEELIELAHQLTKLRKIGAEAVKRPTIDRIKDREEIISEMADVLIMLECLCDLLDIDSDALSTHMWAKLDKFERSLPPVTFPSEID